MERQQTPANNKTVHLILSLLIAAVIIICLILLFSHKPVNVFSVSELIDEYNEYEGYEGIIMTQNKENIFKKEGDISSINVSVNDSVKAGDVVVTYDNTSSTIKIDQDTAELKLLETTIALTENEIADYQTLYNKRLYNGSDEDAEYSKEELHDRIIELKEELSRLHLEYETAKLELKKDTMLLDTGNVCANSDGVISYVGDPNNTETGEILITILSSENSTLTAFVDEFSIGSLKEGDHGMATGTETGTSFPLTVTDIGRLPAEEFSISSNVSFYPVKCSFANQSDAVDSDDSFSVFFDGIDNAESFFLPLAFVKNDNHGYYVWVKGKKSTIEKKYVKTGSILWNSSIEIRDGLEKKDRIAFPFGKLTSGLKTKNADTAALYDY